MASSGRTHEGTSVVSLAQARLGRVPPPDFVAPTRRALVVGFRLPIQGREPALDQVLAHLHGLQALGHSVTVLAVREPEVQCMALAAAGIRVLIPTGPAMSLSDLLGCAGPFDLVFVHGPLAASATMRAALQEALPGVRLLPGPLAVPAAVPLRRAGTLPPYASRHGIALLSQDDPAADQAALHWLTHAVMPLVWQQDPAIPQVRPVPAPQPGSTWFPGPVRLAVAPFQANWAGPGPVLASLGARIPCVMTGLAARGLPLTPALQACVADSSSAFARQILRLYHDPAAAHAVTRAGAALLRRDHSGTAVLAALAAACHAAEVIPLDPHAPARMRTAAP